MEAMKEQQQPSGASAAAQPSEVEQEKVVVEEPVI